MSSQKRLLLALICCAFIVASGVVGYVTIEDYSIFDALYMSVITITTVGFGEIHPLSEHGRIFTTVLILVGFASLGFLGHALAETLIEQAWGDKTGIRKMKKKISQMEGHFIVCGYGRVGAAATELFTKEHVPFIVIESKPDTCQELKKKGILFVEGDATREDALMKAGIEQAKGLLALLNSDPDNLFIVLTARETNISLHIIARAEDSSSEKRIYRAGADRVISPFTTAGKQIATNVLAATGTVIRTEPEIVDPPLVPQWVEVNEGSSMLGKTLDSVAAQMGREILGLRRDGQDTIFPDENTVIQCRDLLFIIDEDREMENQPIQQPVVPEKLVIVDDNPVILRLFSRLFQKAGFKTLTATNGQEGLDLIVQENPAAAVIDYLLPMLSGIEVCAKVRDLGGSFEEMKLVLFTSDEKAETSRQAIRAGADAVVIKSAVASEVVETTLNILRTEREKKQAEPETSLCCSND